MARHLSNLLARLGGGDPAVLEAVPQDRKRFTQMGGVLLTTAGVGTLSMSFALHDGIKAPLVPSVVLGVLWGVIILNLDRFLVLSMGDTRTRGWRLFWLVLPRFMLAVVLAAVVSTPLVLRIFASDITQQLSVIHQQQSSAFAGLVKNNADQQAANKLASQIATDQATLSGHPPQSIVSPGLSQDQAQAQKLQTEVQQDFAIENSKYKAWQCELQGETCADASGKPGNGALARTTEIAYDAARDTYNTVEAEYQQAQDKANSDQKSFATTQSQRLQQEQQEASQALPGLQSEYHALEMKIQATIASGDAANESDSGILAQLQALSVASSHNSSLAAARWTVLALFFMIEILPVTVKALLNLGDPSAYEKVAWDWEGEITDRERILRIENTRIEEAASEARIKAVQDRIREGDLDHQTQMQINEGKAQTRVKVQEDMRLREQDIGKHANEYVASEMVKIVESALMEWGDRVRDELSRNGERNGSGPYHDDQPGPTQQPNDGYDLGPEDEL
jgi:Domain of unknown function (DUF4407)